MKYISLPLRITGILVLAFLTACGSDNSATEVTSSAHPTVFSAHNAAVIDGVTYTWGYNGYGQLGNSSSTNSDLPLIVPGLAQMKGASVGGTHTLSFNNMSTLAWGNNYYGQLGDNSTTARTAPVRVVIDSQGTPLTGVTAVAGGGNHSLALDSNRAVWAWGGNYSGQLGDDTLTSRSIAKQVNLPASAKMIAAGGDHSLALLDDDDKTVWSWGLNENGQLGNDSRDNSMVAVQVLKEDGTPPVVSPLTDITFIAAGGGYSLAVDGSGNVWAWGINDLGQLGIGTWDPATRTMDGSNRIIDVAKQVTADFKAKAVAAGLSHSIALDVDGNVWGWGFNDFGQVGKESLIDADGKKKELLDAVIPPVQVKINELEFLTGVASIAATGNHSLGFYANGNIWAWGENTFGQLGYGTKTSSGFAVQVKLP